MNEEKVVVSDEPRRLGAQYLKDLHNICDKLLYEGRGGAVTPKLLDHMYIAAERDIADNEIMVCLTNHLTAKIITTNLNGDGSFELDFNVEELTNTDPTIYSFKDIITNYGKVVLLALPSPSTEIIDDAGNPVISFNWLVVSENNDPWMYNMIQDILLSEATPSIKS